MAASGFEPRGGSELQKHESRQNKMILVVDSYSTDLNLTLKCFSCNRATLKAQMTNVNDAMFNLVFSVLSTISSHRYRNLLDLGTSNIYYDI